MKTVCPIYVAPTLTLPPLCPVPNPNRNPNRNRKPNPNPNPNTLGQAVVWSLGVLLYSMLLGCPYSYMPSLYSMLLGCSYSYPYSYSYTQP